MDALIVAQHEGLQRMGRMCDNLKKSGLDNVTLGRVQSTLGLLDKKWALIEEQHATLRSEYWNDLKKNDYYTKDFMSIAEETYLQQRGKLVDWERSLQPKAAEQKGSGESQSIIGSPAVTTRRTVLPKIKLPEFSGNYEDWPAFRDHFTSTIGSDEQLPTVEKLHYLRSCVQGEAATMIRNLPATEASYDRAWKELAGYYENTRILVRSYLTRFLALQKMKNENAHELKKIFHGVIVTYDSLENLGRPVQKSEDIFVHLVVELLGPRTRDLWDEHTSDCAEPPSFESLKAFMQRRLQTLDGRLAAREAKSEIGGAKSMGFKAAKSHIAQKKETGRKASKERCSFCQKEHFLMFCDGFKSKPARERKEHVSDSKLCLNCFGRHKVSECMSKKSCTACSERHHTLLHDAYREKKTEEHAATIAHVAQNRIERPVTILLATARVRVADRFGTLHQARALIDQGSETSFISEDLAQRLRLPRKPTSISVIGVGGNQTGVARGRVSLKIKPHFDDTALMVAALVLPRLTVYTGGPNVVSRPWPHFQNLELADPQFLSSDPVDILLGADVFAAILSNGLRKGGPQEPMAQKTSLGWIVSGGAVTSGNGSPSQIYSHQCLATESLTELVQKFWKQEEPPSSSPALSEAELQCEHLFATTHARNADGRYMVRLPLVKELADLTATKHAALRSLISMERRFARDDQLYQLYADFMSQYEVLAHMSPAAAPEKPEAKRICYLPHHGVLRESSTTTKLRVVFNGSQKTSTGESLNDHLLIGQNLLPALTDILLQWRVHRYVVASDVEKMYRQILVHPEDRDLQRIIWRSNPGKVVQEYQLNTVTYGLACAPFLAIRTLKQLADDEEERFPLGARSLRRDVYMDDILTGADTLEETLQLQKQLIELCGAGGFPLKKWAANHPDLLTHISPEDRMTGDPREWQPIDCCTMLGLRWHPSTDSFSFAVRRGKPEPATKRTVLSKTAQLFDPLGWLAPVVIRAKILIQSTWVKGLEWDAPLPEEDCRSWRLFQEELHALEKIRVPRWMLRGETPQGLELHGFADASERAYAAVIYIRSVENTGKVKVCIAAAKSKVAPLKQVSLPRLELCAAALLAQLVAYLKQTLSLQGTVTHAWLDSTVALNWVQGHSSRWKTYVANRVAEIQRLLPDVQWHHIRSRENPADCASRGVSPPELVTHEQWWQGPSWLTLNKEFWPLTTA